MLTTAVTLIASAEADAAAQFFWQDSDPSYYRPAAPTAPPRNPRASKRPAREEVVKDTGAKPQGPLIINVSIEQQKVRVHDSNGLFAESPVSTGMKGHATPMGVFSIIQKHKLHHSNIYSGAPMPFMQRITWSGVAMHAGVLPGYPASHGCIRMPMAFAQKMWNWTKMGARVVVTPGEITPASFSHPLLVAQKAVPQPIIADDGKNDVPAVKSDKGADAGATARPASDKSARSETNLDLRSTVGHATNLRGQTHTADASNAMPAQNATVTMTDAGPTGLQPASTDARQDAPKSEAVKPESETAAVTATEKPAAAGADEVKAAETDSKAEVSTTASVTTEDKPAEAKVEAKSDDVKVEAPSTETAKVEPAKAEPAKDEAPKVEETKAADTKAADSKADDKPAEPVKAVETPAAAPEVKKDTARLPGAEKAAATKETKRPGQIAVFVSRKDGKLYVRENFKPQFDVPVTIAPSDRPLGTHVFTAEADKTDPNLLRWSAVSLPAVARNAVRSDDDDRASRRRKVAGGAPAEARPLPAPNSAAEALDRITVPPEAMARIAEALTTGGSIVVSDHGITQGGETGEGTDFIVPLRAP
ncbi:MAG: L,D-transpeptidase family protein [bacterium]|nr:L,D-transpeptidase family protein [bacterium]